MLPLLKEGTAYVLLRSILEDVPLGEFSGVEEKNEPFYLNEDFNKTLIDAMISIPKVEPGDTVWWHSDIIHRFRK